MNGGQRKRLERDDSEEAAVSAKRAKSKPVPSSPSSEGAEKEHKALPDDHHTKKTGSDEAQDKEEARLLAFFKAIAPEIPKLKSRKNARQRQQMATGLRRCTYFCFNTRYVLFKDADDSCGDLAQYPICLSLVFCSTYQVLQSAARGRVYGGGHAACSEGEIQLLEAGVGGWKLRSRHSSAGRVLAHSDAFGSGRLQGYRRPRRFAAEWLAESL